MLPLTRFLRHWALQHYRRLMQPLRYGTVLCDIADVLHGRDFRFPRHCVFQDLRLFVNACVLPNKAPIRTVSVVLVSCSQLLSSHCCVVAFACLSNGTQVVGYGRLLRLCGYSVAALVRVGLTFQG